MTKMGEESKIGERPLVITIICIFGILAVALVLLGAVIPETRAPFVEEYGGTKLAVVASIAIFQFAGYIGYWKMREWGIYLYLVGYVILIVASAANAVVNTEPGASDFWGPWPLVVIGIGFAYFKRMT